MRVLLAGAALFMIEGGLVTDAIGIGLAAAIYFVQKAFPPPRADAPATIPVRGAD